MIVSFVILVLAVKYLAYFRQKIKILEQTSV